jgi:ankyrin repeat protein
MSIMGHIAILNPAKEGPGSMVYAIDVRDGKWKSAGECALLCAARGLFRPGAAQEAASRTRAESDATPLPAAAPPAPPADLDAVDALGRSAAHAAAAENRAADLMALIGMGANLDRADVCGKKPLYYVETNVETMCGIVLMSHGRQEFLFRPILSKGRTMLHWAARFAHEEIIDIILGPAAERRRRISNAVDDDGSTPLHIACKSNRLHIAAKLIRDGHASKLVADKKGRIPFQLLDPHALKVLKAAMR